LQLPAEEVESIGAIDKAIDIERKDQSVYASVDNGYGRALPLLLDAS